MCPGHDVVKVLAVQLFFEERDNVLVGVAQAEMSQYEHGFWVRAYHRPQLAPHRVPNLRRPFEVAVVEVCTTAVLRSYCRAEDGKWPAHITVGPSGGLGDVMAASQA